MMKGRWSERRQRHAVRLDASVERNDGTEIVGVVTDLSLEGCCLTGSFRIGERLNIRVPRIGKLLGEVRWSFLGRAGVRFINSSEAAGERN